MKKTKFDTKNKTEKIRKVGKSQELSSCLVKVVRVPLLFWVFNKLLQIVFFVLEVVVFRYVAVLYVLVRIEADSFLLSFDLNHYLMLATKQGG